MERVSKKGLKTLICLKFARWYRYRLVRYRYRMPTAPFGTSGIGTGESGTGTVVPFFKYIFSFYIFVNWEQ